MPNRLASVSSPYLRQHADNPVDWYPWCNEAFEKAKLEQKPIFLSIGYSTCHWCHVMAHESFENQEIAKLLNESFISVKCDREERPDVDRVYMSFVQAVTGHGGWPLSVWLTPDLKPFYGGTYFPPEDRQGRAGFPSILKAIAKGWKEDRQTLVIQAESVLSQLKENKNTAITPTSDIGALLVEKGSEAYQACFSQLYESFDSTHGGFGGAPKFPRPSNLDFLFRCAAMQGAKSDVGAAAINMAAPTLSHMARGGIHDHIGGGFHRYSVDVEWFVPHFEKMLYDQGQICVNALEAWQATGDARHIWLARDILDYVIRDLRDPQGGFYSAEDADSTLWDDTSKHAEGAYYVWSNAEILEHLKSDAALFNAAFSIQANGNVAEANDPFQEFKGKNILRMKKSLAAVAKDLNMSVEEASDRLVKSIEVLRSIRSKKPHPHKDDKIITAWNGLMISAFAKASQVLRAFDADLEAEAKHYLNTATQAADFIFNHLFDQKKAVLYRSWRTKRSDAEGFAEDYAFLIQGLLDLYEASFDAKWLKWAVQLQAMMDALFYDSVAGGYFNSAIGAEDIVVRLKEDYDGAEPAPSSVAALNLMRFALLFESSDASSKPKASDHPMQGYREKALKTLMAFEYRWSQAPQALPRMLCALELALEPPRHVVIAGDPKSDNFAALVSVLYESLGPRRSIIAADGSEAHAWLANFAPWISLMKPIANKPTVYLCEGFTCQAPVTTPEDLRKLLSSN